MLDEFEYYLWADVSVDPETFDDEVIKKHSMLKVSIYPLIDFTTFAHHSLHKA